MSTRPQPLSVERLAITSFRNYASLTLPVDTRPVVLVGANGSGKTNILEAVSLVAPGQGLRRAAYPDIARAGGDGSWSVAAKVHSRQGLVDIGTGLPPGGAVASGRGASGRIVRIGGEAKGGSGALADYVEIVWLTPAMDGLFTGPASERRRLLDRLVLCFDPGFRTLAGQFERATQMRNRLLADGVREAARFTGIERIMAETGTAIAAARVATIQRLAAVIDARRERRPDDAFPWSRITLEGSLETALAGAAAVDVEDAYAARLASARERDRAAGRTLEGPHRSDVAVVHGPKDMPARLSSTGEQKALLTGIVLAEAELIAGRHGGSAPLVLLDEITAHLDEHRRAALFEEILEIGCQAWMTGTDKEAFAPLGSSAQAFAICDARLAPLAL